jgi:hypothetical protein
VEGTRENESGFLNKSEHIEISDHRRMFLSHIFEGFAYEDVPWFIR